MTFRERIKNLLSKLRRAKLVDKYRKNHPDNFENLKKDILEYADITFSEKKENIMLIELGTCSYTRRDTFEDNKIYDIKIMLTDEKRITKFLTDMGFNVVVRNQLWQGELYKYLCVSLY